MTDEFYSQMHGLVQWARQVQPYKQSYNQEKFALKGAVPRYADPKNGKHVEILSNMKDVIVKKQLPLYDHKITTSFQLLKTFRNKTEIFQGAEFKERSQELLDIFRQVHMINRDTKSKLEKQHTVLRNLDEDPEAMMDNFHYLLAMEQGNEKQVVNLVQKFQSLSKSFCYVIRDNYFVKMKDLATDKRFLNTHKDIFEAAYMTTLVSEYLVHLHDVEKDEYMGYWKDFYKGYI